MAHLRAAAENVQRVLTLDDLLHEVRDDVTHRQLDVAAEDLDVAERATLTDADAVERTHDGVRQRVLAVRCSSEVLDRELLKSV